MHLSTGPKRSLERVSSPSCVARSTNCIRANERVSRLVALVNDLSDHVDDFGQHKIEEVLASVRP